MFSVLLVQSLPLLQSENFFVRTIEFVECHLVSDIQVAVVGKNALSIHVPCIVFSMHVWIFLIFEIGNGLEVKLLQ